MELQECKLAPGKPANNGYYRKSFKNKVYLAHRLAYTLAYGEPPEGYEIHHLCHNRQCIEPTHLVALTPTEHRLQEIRQRGLTGMAKIHAAKTHCPNGHPFDHHDGRQRTCSNCSKAYKAAWHQEKMKDPAYRQKRNDNKRAYWTRLNERLTK